MDEIMAAFQNDLERHSLPLSKQAVDGAAAPTPVGHQGFPGYTGDDRFRRSLGIRPGIGEGPLATPSRPALRG